MIAQIGTPKLSYFSVVVPDSTNAEAPIKSLEIIKPVGKYTT
jgi:hypothetical protein